MNVGQLDRTESRAGAEGMERQAVGDLGADHPVPAGVQGRRDMEHHPGHPREPAGCRVRPAGALFRHRRREDVRVVRGGEEAGARAEALRPVRPGESRHHVRDGTDARLSGDRPGRDRHHHEFRGLRDGGGDRPSAGTDRGHRGLHLLRIDPPVGGHADRGTVHLGAVLRHDPDRLRPFLQAVHVHGHRPGAPGLLRGRADAERGEELSEELRGRVPGGSGHRAGLHHLFRVRGHSALGGYDRGAGDDGVGLRRGTGIQHADPGGLNQDGGQDHTGNDGTVMRKGRNG